jgi:GT2 family glycosyltransferase
MSNLRLVGLIVGIFGLLLTFVVYRGPRWRRLNFILFGLVSLFLIGVSLKPDLVNSAAGTLALQQKFRGRLLALLIFSNIALWYFFLYLKTRFDEYRYQFDFLVRNLGREELEHLLHDRPMRGGIAVVIPAYNEAENLKELLQKMPGKIRDKKIEVIVVDDGSTDKTARVAAESGYVSARNKTHRGGGAALRLGYDVIKKMKPEIVVTMDADGQHDPGEIGRLIEPILKGEFDFVIGSRILGKAEKSSQLRFLGLHIFNFIISALLGKKISDCTSGFRAFRAGVVDKIMLQEDQFHTSELIIDAVKKGFRIGEVPVTIARRKYGSSKKGKDWTYGLNFAKVIIKSWWR